MLKLNEIDFELKTASLEIELNEDIQDIKAHFPNQMLVPAYMQMSWIEDALALVEPKKSIVSFEAVKFIKKIEPLGTVAIELDLSNPQKAYKFKIFKNLVLLTSGAFTVNA